MFRARAWSGGNRLAIDPPVFFNRVERFVGRLFLLVHEEKLFGKRAILFRDDRPFRVQDAANVGIHLSGARAGQQSLFADGAAASAFTLTGSDVTPAAVTGLVLRPAAFGAGEITIEDGREVIRTS